MQPRADMAHDREESNMPALRPPEAVLPLLLQPIPALLLSHCCSSLDPPGCSQATFQRDPNKLPAARKDQAYYNVSCNPCRRAHK